MNTKDYREFMLILAVIAVVVLVIMSFAVAPDIWDGLFSIAFNIILIIFILGAIFF